MQPLKFPEDFKDWELLPEKAYEFIFLQAKDRYDECMSESESITNKSIKFTISLFAFISAFISLVITKDVPAWLITIGSIAFLIEIGYLGSLIFPKKIIPRGSEPFELFSSDLDGNGFNEGEKIKSVYFSECARYQYRIERMNTLNGSRISRYKTAIWIFFLLLTYTLSIFLVYVYHL